MSCSEDLNSLTVKQLRLLAKERGISLSRIAARKSEIIRTLSNNSQFQPKKIPTLKLRKIPCIPGTIVLNTSQS